MSSVKRRLEILERKVQARAHRSAEEQALSELLGHFTDDELAALEQMAEALDVGWYVVGADALALVSSGFERALELTTSQSAKALAAQWLAHLGGLT